MKKYIILFLGVALVAGFGFMGWKWNLNRTNFSNTTTSTAGKVDGVFQTAGSLVRNNPGYPENVWFVISDTQGNSATRDELFFVEKSECYLGRQNIDCKKLDLPNGTRVRVSGEKVGGKIVVTDLTAESASDLIRVEKINSGDSFYSPLEVSGMARGQWFFEATFPIKIIDLVGKNITSTFASAVGDWMTTEFVPFKSTINFVVVTSTIADLVLAADNPSGLPQNDRDIHIRINLLPPKNSKTVDLFYYNASKDTDSTGNVLCSRAGIVPVKRTVLDNDKYILNTLNLLLQGQISSDEKAVGVTSEFPLADFKISNFSINNGIATISFSDPQNKTTGGSCRVGVLWMQIEETIKQFPGIKKVKFLPETLFQP